MVIRFINIVIALLCMIFSHVSSAHEDVHRVFIITSDKTPVTRQIVSDLHKVIPGAQTLSDLNRINLKDSNAIYLAIGPSSLQSLLAQDIQGTVIAAYTSSQAYHRIVGKSKRHSNAITAVYSDPSPAVQMRLIVRLYRRPPKTAAILSGQSEYLRPILQEAAQHERIKLAIEIKEDDEHITRAINRVSDNTVILAIPDRDLYNADSIRGAILSAYRNNQAMIGFSAALVKAGALASSYSDIEDINTQIGEIVTTFIETGELPAPRFPKYFSVLVNEAVANSLDLVLDDSVRNFSVKPTRK